MAAPRKGTATPLRAVFSPEETKRAVSRVAESVADRRAELGRLQGFVADNAALVSLVNRLPDELSHEIMVPFGGAAFFPGRLIHTNELMVLLGEGYYAQRSAKQTTDILHRRGVELEAQVEAMKATISDLEAEAKFFESTAAEASEGLVEIREEYDEDTESNSSKSEASVATEGMSDKEKEHDRIMARLDELEMEEMEAGSTSEEEQDDDDDEDEDDGGVVTSEDGEENEESGNALCDGNEYNSSSSGASFSGIGGNDRSHGSIQLKSALKKPGGEEVLRGISQAPSAHTSHSVFPGQSSITKSEVRVRKAVSFEDDKHVVGSSKSPSLPLDPAQPAPGFTATRFVSTGVGRSMDGDGDGASRGQPMLEKRPSHRERHFTAGEVVRDVIMGVSDGLTVPFALAAGLSGASAPSSLVLTAGLAEVAAGAISMGLGGYLAAQSEADHYKREMKREQEEIITVPDTEAAEIGEIMSQYGLEPHEYGPVIDGLRRNPQAWLEFMMRFELGLEKPDPKRALQSACTIALSYVIGGLVPLLPYMFISTAQNAMLTSVVVTLVALLFFGYIKGRFTGNRPFTSAVQTAIIGALASAAAYGMAKAVQAR